MEKKILICAILLTLGLLLIGVFYEIRMNERGSDTDKGRQASILASFGTPVNLQGIGINSSSEFYERLQKVMNESDRDLEKYYYPNGPVLGAGYDKNGTVVMIYKDGSVNETTIEEIYRVIETHGEENGIKKIPGTFFSVDMMKMDSQCDPQSAGSRTLIPVDTSVPIRDPMPGIRYSLNESDSDRTLVLAKGDVVEINLQVNPGLGLHWVVPVSGCALELTNEGTFSNDGDFWNVTTYYRARYRAVGYGTSVISGRRILSDEREGDPKFNLTVIVKQP